MYAKISNFIDVETYKETFESNLNKGKESEGARPKFKKRKIYNLISQLSL